jgi:hypothetical protein
MLSVFLPRFEELSWAAFACMALRVALCVLGSLLFYLLFERHTQTLRHMLTVMPRSAEAVKSGAEVIRVKHQR